ncbi:hypothetical protein [Flagellimonas zhangzhouensis]|uniref:Uncharacterized protein n=1 Tax=Flagellimonas zhangzhouensis TaxID=1073328 RepID=A0A1H2Q264_9FLAO|nr:hypothetical protein [Allomuricauda zhangzhouensis]SDQ46515.1 hypothetical protein SAMN05216294_1356 [Allomuricauda zhangzhouensis]SDW00918.1 hypothetical protein SAMN04487892_0008 [Allomuricauda zhangzhouensis]
MKNYFLFLVLILLTVSCKSKEKQNEAIEPTLEEAVDPLKDGQVEIITKSMEFFSADTLYSGWNTLFYENQSQEVHFVLMDLYPEGKDINNTKNELLPPFDEGMKQIMHGDMDKAMEVFGEIPEWYFQVKFMGGTGLISPKHTAKSTVYLEPGLYTMECYVKMFNGEWHTSHGMIKQIIVQEETTDLDQPTASISVDISSTEGIVVHDSITSGNQIFQTNFIDQKIYEHFVGHDVNLVRYETGANLDSLIQWMNWMDPKGLITPSPEGFTFLGGMNNLSEGEKGFFEADLTPGNYVLISEVPAADEKKLLYSFTIN